MRTFLLIGGATLALASCRQAGETAPVTQAEAQKIVTANDAAYGSGDGAKIAALYAKSAYVFDAGNPAPSSDPKVLRQWANDFVSMKPGDFTSTEQKIQIVGPDAFVNSGVFGFTVQAGQARPTVSARFTQVYQRQGDGSWKIVTEHMSMPPAPVSAPAG
jgi:ketosteroid isomerase-like protein